jgi:colanic acid/amylovoran biosynthesis glycosyltransferase
MLPAETQPTGDPALRQIAIFRQNLFRISEPFITQQACRLRRYQPLYVGRFRYGDPPQGARSLALSDVRSWLTLPGIGLQTLTRNPAPYLKLLARERPALIHAHFGIDGVYALPLAKRLGIPLITTFHGFDATMATAAFFSSPAWMNYPLFRGRLAREGSLFLCVSSFIRDRVLAMGFPEQRTRVHYTGVDVRAIRPRAADEEQPVILHVARLVEMKGTRYLIEAFAALSPQHPGAQLVIIGDGALRMSLQALTRSLGLFGKIIFLGALSHVHVLAWMRKATMLVLPSVRTGTGRMEGLGMVLLEAAATGVPVVATRVGGIPEGVLDGQTGFLVAERNAAALASSMTALLDSPPLRHRMGRQARRFVETRFDADALDETLEATYDSVLA